MANLVQWIEEMAGDDPVEAVVIGRLGWGDYGKDRVPQYDEQRRGVVLSWTEARPMLDYDFDDGYGAPGCNAITVWTAGKVMFVSQYDGATCLHSVPRHPVAHDPDMPGG